MCIRDSIGADGEAYWRAREALNELKADDGQTRVKVSGFGEWQDPLLNSLLETTELIKRRWTTLQRDTVKAMLEACLLYTSREWRLHRCKLFLLCLFF